MVLHAHRADNDERTLALQSELVYMPVDIDSTSHLKHLCTATLPSWRKALQAADKMLAYQAACLTSPMLDVDHTADSDSVLAKSVRQMQAMLVHAVACNLAVNQTVA